MSAKTFTTREAAKQIGVSRQTLQTWIAAGEIDAPKPIGVRNATLRLWTRADVERARKFKGILKRGPKSRNKS
jgi:excisionase family DNA binding protein